MMFTVPLYFQVTARVSPTVAGAHLFPAVAGNAVGGLLTGFLIKRWVQPGPIRSRKLIPSNLTDRAGTSP